MGKLTSFTFISLNGYYKGMNGGIDWHQHGGEEAEYSVKSLKSGSTLLFGRVTYEMMASFWRTPMAFNSFPKVAEGMNKANKIVISKSLKSADWTNTTIINDNLSEKIALLKLTKDITLLGSGTVLTQLAIANLIDEYQIMLDPVAISGGTAIFDRIENQLDLKLIKSRNFKSGVMLLHYEPNLMDKASPEELREPATIV